MIFELKYKSIRNLTKLMAEVTTYTTSLPKCTYYTYVPMHWKKKNIRGYNQSQLIAKNLAFQTNTKIISLLNKKNHTLSQKKTRSKEERTKNISNSFEYLQQSEYDKSQPILIIDDVLTTGSTLQACTNLLHENGWKHIHGFCFAQRN